MKIPLILKLKKVKHKEIARAQDIIIDELYKVFENAVLHGGTAIWRCYQGNRFSEDIDTYITKNITKINFFFSNLEKRGFTINKKKISQNSIYSNLQLNGVVVRFEAIFKNLNGFLKEYETVEGNLITVYALKPEDIIKEKVNAYLSRFKVRDIYDIFYMIRYVKKKEEIINPLKKLLKNFKEPIDKEELKVLIIEGLVPDIKKMLKYIENWIL